MTEIWKPVPGYEGVYEVSDRGRVKRITTWANNKTEKIRRLVVASNGYHQVSLSQNGIGKVFTVHSIVMEAFVGPRQDGLQVNHKNGIKTDNRLENLEYVTPGENVLHSYRALRRAPSISCGEQSGKSNLTEKQVLEIRHRYEAGSVSQTQLGEHYGVCHQTIHAIVNRKTWKHI